MAFRRDLGIQFPADSTQGTISQGVRSAKRFVARGSRYGSSLNRSIGWRFGIGTSFFKNTMPTTALPAIEPVPYARFIDLRKTKVVDTIKESIYGVAHKAGIDTILDVENDPELNQQDSLLRKTFFARITSVAFITNVYAYEWHEVIWDEDSGTWMQKIDGKQSTAEVASRAIHGPSGGGAYVTASQIVLMNLERSTTGTWQAVFVNPDPTGVYLGQITAAAANSGSPLYSAEALPQTQYPEITVSSTIPMNRIVAGPDYIAASVGDPCLLVQRMDQSIRLITFSEAIDTEECPATPLSTPMGQPDILVNDVMYVQPIFDATNAIGQAI